MNGAVLYSAVVLHGTFDRLPRLTSEKRVFGSVSYVSVCLDASLQGILDVAQTVERKDGSYSYPNAEDSESLDVDIKETTSCMSQIFSERRHALIGPITRGALRRNMVF